jgi:dipeptidyl aminopeptidase/acylaminoacyl peptidase
VVNAQTGAVSRLRADPRPGLDSLSGLDVAVTSIPAHDGLSIPLHHYLPKGRDPKTQLPVIVHFHGGPAASSRVGWNWMARAFTSQGYAFVEPNIRGSNGFGRAYEMADNREKRTDAIRDLETVNAWLRAQPWADPARLVIYGGSYGGYLVLMGLTRQPSLWSAGVDFVGVANLFTFLESTDQMIRAAFVEEFGDLERDAKLLEEFSPMRDKDKIVRPLFVYQGQNDPRVPRSESDQVVASLRARDVPVEYMVAANEGHSLDRRETRVEFATRVLRFLAEHE